MPHARRIEVAASRVAGWIDRFAARHPGTTVTAGESGLDVRSADGSWAQVSVPLGVGSGRTVEESLDALGRPRRLALLLVRKGGYAVAVVGAGRVERSKVGRRHVQGRTKAGGWSQQRYQRRRRHQAEAAYAAATDWAAEVLAPAVDTLDGLVVGGDAAAIEHVLGDDRLRSVAALPRRTLPNVADPRAGVLADAVRRSATVDVMVHDVTRDG